MPRDTFSALWITKTLGISPQNASKTEKDREFTKIITDSRKIEPGCLFVALKGESFDGHDFIASALERGAGGILCDANRAPTSSSAWIFAVPDSLEAYRALGAAWRQNFDIPLVLVAGSAGKTTTKELLAALLRGKYGSVLKTEGSQNGFVGIPMTLLELRSKHGAAVIEVGIDEIGAMKKHVAIVRPTHSLLTAIGPEHLEKLIDLETVAREEAFALSEVASAGGKTILNLDDPLIAGNFHGTPTLSYSLTGQTRAKTLRGEIRGKDLILNGSEAFELPLPGKHNALNLLAALAVATELGLTSAEMRQGLSLFKGAEGRSQLRTLAGGIEVLCDYYNSQPASLVAGIELLSQLSGKPRFACLGDMLELGSGEEGFHRNVAEPLIQNKIDHVLLYGPRMKWLQDELTRRGYTGSVEHFPTHQALAERLSTSLKPHSAVLIKGSRGMKMEEVWKLVETSRK